MTVIYCKSGENGSCAYGVSMAEDRLSFPNCVLQYSRNTRFVVYIVFDRCQVSIHFFEKFKISHNVLVTLLGIQGHQGVVFDNYEIHVYFKGYSKIIENYFIIFLTLKRSNSCGLQILWGFNIINWNLENIHIMWNVSLCQMSSQLKKTH